MAAAGQGDKFLVTINGLIHGQRTMTTFQYSLEDVTGALTVQDCYAALSSDFRAVGGMIELIKNAAPSTWTFTEAWYQKIASVRQVRLVESLSSGPGVRAASQVTQLAGVISRFGEVASRRARGRVYIPISSGDVTSGAIVFALAGILASVAQQMLVEIPVLVNVATLKPWIYTPPKGNPPLATNVQLYGTAVQTTARTLTRRTVGRGI